MGRISIARPLLTLVITGLFIASASAVDNSSMGESADAIKARIQKDLDAVAAKPSPRVLVIPIREEIDLKTAVYVEREMKRVAEEKFDLVLADLNTPGGRGDAMNRICDAFLQRDVPAAKRAPVVAFVNSDAFSAGAIIAMSCDRIYMAPGGKIGAATGYVIDPQTGLPAKLPEDVEAKFLSAEKAEVRALVKQKGYSPDVAVAMVDRSVGLSEYLIDGKKEFLNDKELENRKLALGLDKLKPDELEKRVKLVKVICKNGELATFDYQEAKSIGLAADILDSRESVFKALTLRSPVVIQTAHNWSEDVFGFLASDGVKAILLLLGLLGIYLEFKMPGVALPGILGVICLALFFFSQYFMGLAGYTGILLFLLGLALLLVELFILPGFALPGIVGVLLMIAGLFFGMQPWAVPNVQNPLDMHLFMVNVIVLCVALICLAIFAVVAAKFLPSTPFFKRIILVSRGPEGELRASGTLEEAEKSLVGAKGRVLSRLRPAGRAEFGEKILDVVTEGQFIEEGATVEVTAVEGNRVVVRKVE